MADFNEHVLKVRAALDKASQQEMRETMRSIFTDESHIDFNNPENIKGLRALADVMEKIFTKAGNTKFDFSKMIRMPGPELFDELKKAALEFDAVWSSIVTNMGNIGDGISQGIANGIVGGVSAGVDGAIKEAEAKLDGLFKAQAEKMKQIEDLSNKQRKKEEMMNRLDFDNAFEIDTKIKYTSDEDLKKQVREIEGVYKDAFANLMDAADNDKVTEPVLQRFKDAAQEMLKVRNTIEDLTEKQIRQRVNGRSTFTNKAEALFGSSFVEKMLGDESDSLEVQIGDAMDIFTDLFDLEDIVIDIESVQKELKGIEREIENITSQHPELIERKEAAEAEERLNKIREAYERLFTSRDGKTLKKGSLKERDLKHIENSLAYTGYGDDIKALPADASDAQLARQAKVSAKAREKLEEAFRLYDESDSQKWEVRAQYLIKAVAEYESILNNPNASRDLLEGYESQYQVLKDQAVAEREKLEAVVDMARSVNQGPQQSNVDDVEKVTQSNNEAAVATQQKREEEEKFAQAQEQSAKAASEQVAFEEKEKALILERKEILAEMLRMSNEAGLFFDSKTGNTSDIVEGGAHSVETTLGAWKQAATEFDTRLHSHNYDVAAPSISGTENDFNVWIKGFEHIRKQAILANKELLAFDFSSLKSVDVLKEIAAKYRVAATPILEKFNPRHNMKAIEAHGGIQGFMETEQAELRQALETIMSEYPGVMKSYKLSPDIVEISKDANFKGSATGSYQDKVEPIKKEADAHRVNAETIKEETRAQEELNNIKNQNIDVDDDAETLAKENGALADKLELLQEIAEQYGNNISQKQRDRYEELNQKDMNEGLTPKEDERYWELGEQIEEADSALEEFGQTYDKIIVKLANGKKVEILPNDQGLRTLAKIDEEYGESYNGVEIEDITFERVKQEAIATEQAVDGLNESLEKTQQLTSGNGTGTGTGDASSAELETARAEAEQQRLANEQLVDEKLTLQNDLDVANAQIKLAQDSEMSARAELYEVEQQLADEQHEKSVYDAALTEMTDELHAKDVEIYDLREQLANVDTEVGDAKTSFDADELKNILNAITYNVKVIQDADSTENKVAIDETSLEATLTKVFTNILNPQTIQNDSTTVQSPWAHETTLQAVKSVLESMDQKIAKGGTVTKKDSGAPSKKESNNDSQKQTGRTTAIRSLTSDYEALGKLRAQYEKDGNLETKARLQNLAEEVRYKKQSLDLTTDEVIALRQRSDVAYDAEKRLIAAAKAQKAIDDKRKAADKNTKQQAKDAENAWKKRVKEAQRATGINAATSTANAGDQTVIRTIGTENLSDDVENKARELSNQIVALRKLRDEIDAKGDKATQEDRDDLSEQISKVKELKAELDGYLKVHEKYSGDNATTIEGDADVFKNLDMKAYEQQLTSAVMAATNGKAKISGFNAETKELTYTVKTGAHTFTTYTAAVDQVGNRLASLQGQTKHTETILAAITRKTKEIFTYFGGSSLVFKFFNEIKRGIQYIKEIDKALTELKKVTDETEETYERFLETAAKTGSKIGATISSVIEATATFAKLGYDMATASEMAEAALVYKNVGDNIASAEDAADSIISTLKGFGLEASESMAIVDRFNEVGNRFAITSQGIGEALRLSASALNEGGNSLDESIALITAANEVVNDPSSVGTALKTLTLRLRGSKTELEEMGEDVTDMATTTSQLQAKLLALTGGKVDIMLDANTFKNSTQILREMSAAWEDMNDIQRASALELMGGKRQANVLSALIKNFDTVESAIEASAGSAGSALAENKRWLDSIEGKMSQFNNSVQSLWQNILGSDVIKDIIGWFTDIIKSLDTTKGKILAIVKAVALLMAYKKINPLDWITKFGNISNAIKTDGLKSYIMSLFQVSAAQKTVTADTLVGTIAQEQNNVATQQQIISKLGLTNVTGALTAAQKLQAAQELVTLFHGGMISEDLATRMAAMLGYKFSVDSANTATIALDTTTKSFMASNPVGWILLIVSAVAGLTMALSNLSDTIAETEEAAKETLSTYHQTQDTLRTHKKTIEDISDDYKKLADGVDDLGRNVSLSTDEYERYNEIANKIAEMFPDMISGYTNEGNAIIALKGNVEALTAAYEEEARAARDAILVGQGKVYEDFLNKTTTESGGVSWNDHIGYSDYMKVIQAYIDQEKGNFDSMINIMEEDYFTLAVKKMKEDLGFSANDLEWEASLSSLEALLRRVQKEANAASAGVRTVLNAYLQQNWDYINLTNEGKNIAQSIISGFDTEFYSNFASAEEMEAWVSANVIQPLQRVDNMAEFTAVFDIQTQFNDGKISVDEYINKITEFTELLKKLGFDEEIIKTVQGIFKVEDYEIKKNSAMEILDSEGDSQVGKLSKTDLDIIDKNKTKWKEEYKIDDGALMTWDDLLDAIQRVKDGMWEASIAFDEISEKIDGIQDAYSALTDAVDQYNEYGYLTLDNLQALLSLEPEYLALLQMENGQLTINQAAMEAMIQTKLDEAKATAVQSAITQLNALAARTEADEINNSANAAANAISGLGSYADSLNIVTQNAIGAAGAVSAFNTAVAGAQGNGLVDQSEIDAIISNMNNTILLIDSIGANLGNNFNQIVNPSGGKDKDSGDVADDAFQREMDYWENRIAANQAKYDQLQNEIDLLESKGQKADTSFYQDQIKLEKEREYLLKQQQNAALARLKDIEAAGGKGNEQWWEAAEIFNSIEGELDDVTASIVDLQDAIGEIDTYKLEEFSTRLDNLTSKLETIRNLIAPNGEEDWFDDEGNWTDAGIAYLGSYLQDLEFFKQGYQYTIDEMAKYESPYEGNEAHYANLGIHSEQEYYDKVEELITQQYDYAESISDTKQSVVDMYESNIDAVEEYVDTLVDSYNDYIDSVKEALDAERELFDFKKDVQKQAKDIAEIERRIASLSGSENAADIAERRKLEAQLYESRESLNDTYYDHAKESQQNALDEEAKVYEETMALMVEGMRTGLEEATVNMQAFLDKVTIAVSMNAEDVLAKYRETELPLDDALTNPWEKAKDAVGSYGDNAKNLMDVWKTDGYFAEFKSTASTNLQSPWNAGVTAANAFKTGVNTVMDDVAAKIATNVKTASSELSKLYQQIITTEQRAAEVDLPPDGNGNSNQTIQPVGSRYKVFATLDMGGTKLSASGISDIESRAKSSAMLDLMSKYEAYQKSRGISESSYESSWLKTWKNRVKYTTESTYAKGTLGTKRDGWAITDESWIGEEITLAAGKNGQLQYLKKGSAVMPADISANLVEWGKLNPDMLNVGATPNINLINNAVNKPEFNFTFDALVKADNITKETLPAVKELVAQELNRFTKELNYAIKGKGGR